jgi:hypothetical protein
MVVENEVVTKEDSCIVQMVMKEERYLNLMAEWGMVEESL